ncbi:lytic transglycosylase domain-containing protein [Burkholderia cenocepacia]|uniref:lytic transglycosylase domain-containing protein n=1 Tax=Burkholderia cenocepacia TaxID=95486 RepID=UPI00201921F4|nr:lytic transglycosylase domain-containing protein [Burkholderia cenocepacia]MCO1396424.1 lytic transglycosylase domain-containing protein [Burkholderia cenocepacia]MCO1408998.1 lytic transglycosylase domain-containing protein [Burkholderia cenocepacia]UQN92027.1 lytic transglycosylase domain-containing protein [Burkholderia cenocepacia]UQN99176.1 lytic transglycosylase domain-containing protein [Burkholderia cenocepacia]UQP50869.1 lytic transglycosylase domain-containing protein [Burkholderi
MSAADFDPIFQAAGQQFNVDPALLKGIATVESNFNPAARSDAGAIGLMQMLPTTAKALGVDPTDPAQSIYGAAKLMQENMARYGGNVEQAVAAYHGGTNQANWGPKTQAYVGKVANAFGQIKQSGGYAPSPAAQGASPAAAAPDDIDALLSARASGATAAPQSPTAPAQGAPDPIDSMLSARASGSQPASAPVPTAPGAAPAFAGASGAQPSGQWKAPNSVLMGMGDIVRGGAQNIVHGLSWLADKVAPDSQFAKDARAALPQMAQTVSTQNAAYDAQRQAQQPQTLTGIVTGQQPKPGFDIGRAAGQLLAAAPMAYALPAGSGVLGVPAAGALSGALTSAMMPADANSSFADQKLEQLRTGAATGAVAAPLARALGMAIRGVGGEAQRRLADAGVTMTPGQILGGGFARTEEKMTSMPIVGDMIKNAQQRSVQSFNRAAYNEALEPLGAQYAGPVGTEGIAAVQRTIGDAYDNALSRMTFRATDPQFQADITNLAGMAQGLPPAQQQTFTNVLRTQVFGKLGPQGQMDGQTLQGAQSEIGRLARGYGADPSFDNQQLGAALGEIRNAIDNSLARYNPQDAVEQLANANSAFARFVRVQQAAASKGAMDNQGIFTPAQLNSAVRATDQSVRKGAVARGDALMQDFSTAGQSVLGGKYPDSGTPGRAALMGALGALGGGGAAMAGYGIPAAIGGAAAALPYTALGQRIGQALLMSRPAAAVPVVNALTRGVVPLVPALGAALVNGVQQAK